MSEPYLSPDLSNTEAYERWMKSGPHNHRETWDAARRHYIERLKARATGINGHYVALLLAEAMLTAAPEEHS